MRHTSLDPGLGSEAKGGNFYALFLQCYNCVEGTSIFKVETAQPCGDNASHCAARCMVG